MRREAEKSAVGCREQQMGTSQAKATLRGMSSREPLQAAENQQVGAENTLQAGQTRSLPRFLEISNQLLPAGQ